MMTSKKVYDFTSYCKSQISPFKATQEELNTYNSINSYLFGESGLYELKKGLFIRGVVGCGKTTMIKMAQRFRSAFFNVKITNTNMLVENYEAGSDIERYLKDEWVFDDFGTEQQANYYGKPTELMRQIIELRYDKWKFYGLRTHFTTNLNNEEIKTRYGDRVYDRLKEMCNVIKYPYSESRRGESDIKKLESMNDIQAKIDLEKEQQKELEKKAYYAKKKAEIIELFNESVKQKKNLIEEKSLDECFIIFDAYQQIWCIDLFEKNGINPNKIEDSEEYQSMYKKNQVGVARGEHKLKNLIDKQAFYKSNAIKQLKKEILVKMLNKKLNAEV